MVESKKPAGTAKLQRKSRRRRHQAGGGGEALVTPQRKRRDFQCHSRLTEKNKRRNPSVTNLSVAGLLPQLSCSTPVILLTVLENQVFCRLSPLLKTVCGFWLLTFRLELIDGLFKYTTFLLHSIGSQQKQPRRKGQLYSRDS